MSKLKLAILDLYNGIPNQGMRCIREIVAHYEDRLEATVFDVRSDNLVPDLSYDIFISSGGPGDPRDGRGRDGWETLWTDWLTEVTEHNKTAAKPKHVFFICHSFQMAVHHFKMANVCARNGISFGTFPVHKSEAGKTDVLFNELENPFYAADFRHYQVIEPDDDRFAELGAEILALEKIRPHVDLERAVMAVRWSPEIVGVQFHPEADAEGMLEQFSRPDIKAEIIADHGREKWLQTMADLSNPERIGHTHDHVIFGFLDRAIAALSERPTESVPPVVGR